MSLSLLPLACVSTRDFSNIQIPLTIEMSCLEENRQGT